MKTPGESASTVIYFSPYRQISALREFMRGREYHASSTDKKIVLRNSYSHQDGAFELF